MIIELSARSFDNAAAMMASAAAVRRRLLHPSAIRPALSPVAIDAEPVVVRQLVRAEKRRPLDAHVMAFRRWQMAASAGPCTKHLLARCRELSIDFDVMIGPSRLRNIAHIRQMLMWEVKTIIQPTMSYPELGRLFGGRDHTTALHGVKAHARRIGGAA